MTRTREHNPVASVFVLLVCGILAGVVVAAAAFPSVALAGLGAKAASDSFENLPTELKIPPLSQTSNVYAADGTFVAAFYDENRVPATLKQIPVYVQNAIIAAEDVRFRQHPGVDIQGVFRALVRTSAGSTQGASTLTQQYVKQVLLQNAKTDAEREEAAGLNPARKIREMRYALALEKRFSKDEILIRYLNIAYFGQGAYGIGAAAQAYFSKPVTKLTIGEAAYLAGLVQSPTTYGKNRQKALDRHDYVLAQMQKYHWITDAQFTAARKDPVTLHPSTPRASCANVRENWGFFCDWFESWWAENPAFGTTPDERKALLFHGGYTIKLSLDPRVQRVAQAAADAQYTRNNQKAKGIVLLDPRTGAVKAMAINRTYSNDRSLNKPVMVNGHALLDKHGKPKIGSFPNTTIPLLTGSEATKHDFDGFHSGSTFKMFTMVTALLHGMPLSTLEHVKPSYTTKRGYTTLNWDSGKNGGKDHGNLNMWQSFGMSYNTYFVPLEETLGVANVVNTAAAMGIKFYPGPATPGYPRGENTVENVRTFEAFTLGQASYTYPLHLASAYGTLANRGVHCEPRPTLDIRDRTGALVPASKPSCKRVLPAEVADAATDAARCPVGDRAQGGSCSGGTGTSVGRAISRPVAGKTGSTQNNEAVWFAGFTPQLAAASFGADPDAPGLGHQAKDTYVNQIFSQVMSAALQGVPVENFVAPPKSLTRGVPQTVPNVDGDSVASATDRLRADGFVVTVSAKQVNSDQPAGTVAYTSPDGGSTGSQGGLVTIYVSNGVPADSSPTPTKSPPPGHGHGH